MQARYRRLDKTLAILRLRRRLRETAIGQGLRDGIANLKATQLHEQAPGEIELRMGTLITVMSKKEQDQVLNEQSTEQRIGPGVYSESHCYSKTIFISISRSNSLKLASEPKPSPALKGRPSQREGDLPFCDCENGTSKGQFGTLGNEPIFASQIQEQHSIEPNRWLSKLGCGCVN